jgi:hypothetical protein
VTIVTGIVPDLASSSASRLSLHRERREDRHRKITRDITVAYNAGLENDALDELGAVILLRHVAVKIACASIIFLGNDHGDLCRAAGPAPPSSGWDRCSLFGALSLSIWVDLLLSASL